MLKFEKGCRSMQSSIFVLKDNKNMYAARTSIFDDANNHRFTYIYSTHLAGGLPFYINEHSAMEALDELKCANGIACFEREFHVENVDRLETRRKEGIIIFPNSPLKFLHRVY
jgi:hypothetical protein